MQKTFLVEEIKQKETQMGPLRGSLRLIPPRGIRKIWAQKKDHYQSKIEIKKTFPRRRNKTERDSNGTPQWITR